VNRIVIIGNGFDIAHGLRTGYLDFIKSLKDEFITALNTAGQEAYVLSHPLFGFGPAEATIIQQGADRVKIDHNKGSQLDRWEDLNQYTFIRQALNGNEIPESPKARVHTKSVFLNYCIESSTSKTWGGFESDYRVWLVRLIKAKSNQLVPGLPKGYTVEQLNEELRQIIKLLQEYLTTKITVPQTLDKNIFFRLFTRQLTRWAMDENDDSRFGSLRSADRSIEENSLEHVLFLSFNYTDTIKRYVFSPENRPVIEQITSLRTSDICSQTSLRYIHGYLDERGLDPLIFGYGDELDENQAILETMDDNFLKHIKSVLYTRNSYYRELIDFADAKEFDIVVYGHSCSTTDRTLLNTLFEHRNCVSIQPFLYDPADTSIYINIYRCFKDKKLMRARVVDQTNTINGWQTRDIAKGSYLDH
jgi:hypothetical protein